MNPSSPAPTPAGPPAVESWLEARMIDAIWRFSHADETPADRLGRLLAFPVGIELMTELQEMNVDELAADERLIHSHLWERCVGWVVSQAADSASGFIRAVTDPPENRMFTRAGVDIADEISLDEVSLATGLSTYRAATRVLMGEAFAADGPLAETGKALRSGRISLEVASAFVDATMVLSPEQATAVQNRVLPRAVSVIDIDTGEGCWRTRSWAVRELRRAIIAVDPDAAAKRREEQRRRRGVTISFDYDSGMAWLNAYLPAHEAMVIYDTLTAMATRLREDDTAADPEARTRGWDTARADALLAAVRSAGDHLAETGALPSVHGHDRIELGVIIDLPTLLNLADHPGEILGYGPIDPDYARQLAAQADSWRRWVIEPVTGHLIDLGRSRYRPSQELRDYILAAYPECSDPTCDRHSSRLEIDHAIEWQDGGSTSAANLHTMCWQDHQAKTQNLTSVRMNADGTVTHTSRHGIERTSEPYWRTYADNIAADQSDTPPF